MRDILFRVWDGNRMTNKIRLEFAHGLRLVSVDNLGFDMVGDDKCVLMQSTGLKDKNGILIYEGDIVTEHLLRATKLGEINYEIVWWSDYHGFAITSLSDDGSEKYIHEMRSKDGISKNLEIIGNIYENPELLPQSKPVV
jgi:uncharacterized phage protein (TIGR01671 family)